MITAILVVRIYSKNFEESKLKNKIYLNIYQNYP